jgi:hypothetical protein
VRHQQLRALRDEDRRRVHAEGEGGVGDGGNGGALRDPVDRLAERGERHRRDHAGLVDGLAGGLGVGFEEDGFDVPGPRLPAGDRVLQVAEADPGERVGVGVELELDVGH